MLAGNRRLLFASLIGYAVSILADGLCKKRGRSAALIERSNANRIELTSKLGFFPADCN
jgi:hypothetical protein